MAPNNWGLYLARPTTPISNPLEVSTQTDPTNPPEWVDMSIQINDTTNALSVDDQNCNYEEELAAQTAIADKAKE